MRQQHPMTIHECRDDMLRAIVQRPDWKIAEVGVFLGDFSEFLRGLQPSELHLIDPFQGQLCSGDRDGNNIRSCDGQFALQYVRNRFIDARNVFLHRLSSPAGLLQFAPGFFDLVYLDGDHTYEGVKKDLTAALRVVKEGGWITGHDYGLNRAKCPHEYTFGVRRAIVEFCDATGLHVSQLSNDGYQSYGIHVSKQDRACLQSRSSLSACVSC